MDGVEKLVEKDGPSLIDGVKVEVPDGWVHVRASGTEPMIRVISENRSKEKAQEDLDRLTAFIAQLV
jgi:phosphomannomutase